MLEAEAQAREVAGDLVEPQDVVVLDPVVVHAGVEREEQVGLLRRRINLQRRRAEQVKLLGVGVELDPAQAGVGDALHLVAPVGAAEVDRTEAVKARPAFQLFR